MLENELICRALVAALLNLCSRFGTVSDKHALYYLHTGPAVIDLVKEVALTPDRCIHIRSGRLVVRD